LYNPFKKPSAVAAATTIATATKSDSALSDDVANRQLYQWLWQYPDPDEMLRKAGLSRSALKITEYDDEVSQCMDTRKEAVVGTPWCLEPNQTRISKNMTAMLEPHMENLVRGAMDAVFYGYSAIEVVYKGSPGSISIDHLSLKPMDWFTFNADGWQYIDDGGAHYPLDPRKFIVTVRAPTFINPYGEALLSRIWWAVFFKKHGRQSWARFLERFGEPLLIGKTADQKKFIDDLVALGMASGLPVQPDDDVIPVTVSQAGEFERFENVLCRSIQKLILGQTLTSDASSGGSFAAAKVHNDIREDKRRADTRLVAASVQQLVNTLAELNGWAAPKFIMADDSGLEMKRAERDVLLVNGGVLSLSETYLLDRYDYRQGDFTIPTNSVLPTPTQGPQDTSMSFFALDKPPIVNGSIAFTQDQQVIEDLADAVLNALNSPIDPALIATAIRAAKNPQDLEDRLAAVLTSADISSFSSTLEKALFAADIMGYAHAG
jgi:phage gp29-like protein